jgi:transcription initiation factor TFIID subunit 8
MADNDELSSASATPDTPTESRKRSSPMQIDEEYEEERVTKKPRVASTELQTPPPERDTSPVYPECVTSNSFDTAHSDGLRKSIALALKHVGFDGATKEAMEAFTGEVDACEICICLL